MKPDSVPSKKGPERSARRQAAEAAGLSRSQMWRAMQVADIPADEFEALVESDTPPTVTELVELSRQQKGHSPRSTRPARREFCPHCGESLAKEVQA